MCYDSYKKENVYYHLGKEDSTTAQVVEGVASAHKIKNKINNYKSN